MPFSTSSLPSGPLKGRWSIRFVCVLLALLFYCAFTLKLILSTPPGNNEAWFASPAVDLLVRHRMGTPVIGGTGTWLAGIGQHTYWTMPLYYLVQVPWYLCVGFGIITQRLLTLLCGLGTLLCVYLFARRLSTAWVASLSVILTCFDVAFIQFSAIGRMDMLSAFLGFAALALYVNLRETGLRRAVVLANAAAAASCMTHPCGFLAMTTLWALMAYLDRKRLRLWDVVAAVAPYAIALCLWAVYIARDPASFVAQMRGNTKGVRAVEGGPDRFSQLRHPLQAVHAEISQRYVGGEHSLFVPALYLLALLAIVVLAWMSRRKEHVVFAIVGVLYFVELALLDGLKRTTYLVHSVPALAMALAAVIGFLLLRAQAAGSRAGQWTLAVAVLGIVSVEGMNLVRHAPSSRNLENYASVLQFVEANHSPGEQIIAPAEFAYRLGFYNGLDDDWQVGYYSHKSPRIIVVGGLARGWIEGPQAKAPAAARFLDQRFAHDYVEVMKNPRFEVWARKDQVAAMIRPEPDTSGGSLASALRELRPTPIRRQ